MSAGDCFHCQEPGHWARDCPLKTPTKPTAASPPGMSAGDCFHCQEPGHWARDCPLKTPTKPTAASPPGMSAGDCFHCQEPGHWARDCPLKTPTKPTAEAASPPVIQCRCDVGACLVLTSKTQKNTNRRFYKCPAGCGFFKWCDEVSIKSRPVSDKPICRCGSGPCRRVTVTDGPNANRSYFVCCVQKGFGACGFFQWENEPGEAGTGSPCSTLLTSPNFDSADNENLLPESDLNSGSTLPTHEFTHIIPVETKEGDGVVDGFEQSLANKPVGQNQGVFPKDAVHIEAEEQVPPSLPLKHNESQVQALCSDYSTKSAHPEFCGKDSYAVEAACVLGETGLSQNISAPTSNGTTRSEHRSTTSREAEASFSGGSILMDLIERYNSQKLHFENVSLKHVDALTAFTRSYKQLQSLHDTAHSLTTQLVEVEKQMNLSEAETSKFATRLLEVSSEMVKSQKIMVETAGKLAMEVKVYKQKGFAAP